MCSHCLHYAFVYEIGFLSELLDRMQSVQAFLDKSWFRSSAYTTRSVGSVQEVVMLLKTKRLRQGDILKSATALVLSDGKKT